MYWIQCRLVMAVVVAVLAMMSSSYAQEQPDSMSQLPAPFSLTTPKAGWYGVVIPHMGTVDVPAAMEVQNEHFRAIKKQFMPPDDSDLMGEVIIQQAGLNAGQPEALQRYFRLMIETKRLSPEPDLTLDAMASLSEEERNEYAKAFMEGMAETGSPGLIETYRPSLEAVGNAHALCMAYRRQGKEGPVLVRKYILFNYDRAHQITLSYRVSEASLWEEHLQTILDSFIISEAGTSSVNYAATPTPPTVAASEPRKQPMANQPLTTGLPPPGVPTWPDWIVLILVNGALTWGIGLAPPLLIRYVIVRRPLPKSGAFTTVAIFWFININLFIELGSTSRSHGALAFVACVSYYILRKRPKPALAPVPSATVPADDSNVRLRGDSPGRGR